MLTTISLDRNDAAVLVDGAREAANAMGVPMSIAVSDPAGNLIMFEQMDGAKVSSIATAIDKAFTGATARKGTHIYNQLCVPGEPTFGIHNTNGGRFSIIGGGLPVMADDAVIGGVGISSGTAGEDLEVAQAAVEHFQKVVAGAS